MTADGAPGQFNRDKVWEQRDVFSGKASEIVRQLGFAGIALVWLFRVEGQGGFDVLPPRLRFPATLVVLALALDLLQYVWGSAAWGILGRTKERRIQAGKASEPFDAPVWINYPTNFFFWGKIIAIGTAYLLMTGYVGQRIL